MLIGSRLRSLRQNMELSLRTLSEQTGFSASFLSLVENDKASPSVSSLERIAAAFGLSLAEFFQGTEEQPYQVVRARERLAYVSEWSHIVVELMAQRPAGGALFPLVLRMAPGSHTGQHPRAGLTEEFALVLEGSATLVREKGETTLEIGDSVSLSAGTARSWENRSEQPAVVLVVGHRANSWGQPQVQRPAEAGQEQDSDRENLG
jgi:transcriptional regulator with XRE-family HTH domain